MSVVHWRLPFLLILVLISTIRLSYQQQPTEIFGDSELTTSTTQHLVCSGLTYTFTCAGSNQVIDIGDNIIWGVMFDVAPLVQGELCRHSNEDCQVEITQDSSFQETLANNCQSENSCTFLVPSLQLAACGDNFSHYAFLSFTCTTVVTGDTAADGSIGDTIESTTVLYIPDELVSPSGPYRDPKNDVNRYKTQAAYCTDHRYSFACDEPDQVIWVGKGVRWGSKQPPFSVNDTCKPRTGDCEYNDDTSSFLQMIIARCNYRNTCWFDIPRKPISCSGLGGEQRLADWVLLLFICGKTLNWTPPPLPTPDVIPSTLPPQPTSLMTDTTTGDTTQTTGQTDPILSSNQPIGLTTITGPPATPPTTDPFLTPPIPRSSTTKVDPLFTPPLPSSLTNIPGDPTASTAASAGSASPTAATPINPTDIPTAATPINPTDIPTAATPINPTDIPTAATVSESSGVTTLTTNPDIRSSSTTLLPGGTSAITTPTTAGSSQTAVTASSRPITAPSSSPSMATGDTTLSRVSTNASITTTPGASTGLVTVTDPTSLAVISMTNDWMYVAIAFISVAVLLTVALVMTCIYWKRRKANYNRQRAEQQQFESAPHFDAETGSSRSTSAMVQ